MGTLGNPTSCSQALSLPTGGPTSGHLPHRSCPTAGPESSSAGTSCAPGEPADGQLHAPLNPHDQAPLMLLSGLDLGSGAEVHSSSVIPPLELVFATVSPKTAPLPVGILVIICPAGASHRPGSKSAPKLEGKQALCCRHVRSCTPTPGGRRAHHWVGIPHGPSPIRVGTPSRDKRILSCWAPYLLPLSH